MRDIVKSVIADYLKALVLKELPEIAKRLRSLPQGELKLWHTLALYDSSDEIELIYKIDWLSANDARGSIELTNRGDIREFISFQTFICLTTNEINCEITDYFVDGYNSFIAKEVIKQLIVSDKEHLSYYLEKLIADKLNNSEHKAVDDHTTFYSCEAFSLCSALEYDLGDGETVTHTAVYLYLAYENDLTTMRIAKKLNSYETVSLITESKELDDFVLPYWMRKLIFNYMFDFND